MSVEGGYFFENNEIKHKINVINMDGRFRIMSNTQRRPFTVCSGWKHGYVARDMK